MIKFNLDLRKLDKAVKKLNKEVDAGIERIASNIANSVPYITSFDETESIPFATMNTLSLQITAPEEQLMDISTIVIDDLAITAEQQLEQLVTEIIRKRL